MNASRITYAATHSRSTTRARRAGATFFIAETTSGTLPNGSMTSVSRTAAEKISVPGIVFGFVCVRCSRTVGSRGHCRAARQSAIRKA